MGRQLVTLHLCLCGLVSTGVAEFVGLIQGLLPWGMGKYCYNHRGSLLNLVLAYLSTVKVFKPRFNHRGSLLKPMQACLSVGKDHQVTIQ